MTAELIAQESPHVRDEFLALARIICEREQRSVTTLDRFTLSWTPEDPEAFVQGVSLPNITLRSRVEAGKLDISTVIFRIDGEDEGQLMVASANKPEVHDKDFDRSFLETFKGIYNAHAHTLCLRSLRQKRQREVQRLKLLQPREIESSFMTRDKRRSTSIK